MRVKRISLFLFLLVLQAQCSAAAEAIYRRDIRGEFAAVYQEIYRSLEEARFLVVFETNIGANLAKNAERWGENYNRNGFEDVRSMVICNPWYANQLLNLDPRMMAVCPMSVTLIGKGGVVMVLFERLTTLVPDSPAAGVLWEIENTVMGAIEDVAAAHSPGADPVFPAAPGTPGHPVPDRRRASLPRLPGAGASGPPGFHPLCADLR